MLNNDGTIAAIATAVGGGIGIIRISGSESVAILKKIFRGSNKSFESHKLYYGKIYDEENDIIIDEVLASVMYAPKSYTVEDVVEVNCHGGVVPLRQILELALKNGARLAEAGEFTKRAFLNGRIDLPQAEAVADIINAKTSMQHNAALSQLNGGLSRKVNEYRDIILSLMAGIEASIDYPEHESEFAIQQGIAAQVSGIMQKIHRLIESSKSGKIIREGINTVIAGKPNVGKSSLLNALLQEERAIVTDLPGTTRDTLTEYINLSGILLKISDTAGIRDTGDAVEKIGVGRSVRLIESAELVIVVLDAASSLDAYDLEVLEKIKDKKAVIAVNKSDLQPVIGYGELSGYGKPIINVSAKNFYGIEALKGKISEMFFSGGLDAENAELITNVRHIQALQESYEKLGLAKETAQNGLPVDFISIDLRAAYDTLGCITGRNMGDDLVDRIFKEFCLGK